MASNQSSSKTVRGIRLLVPRVDNLSDCVGTGWKEDQSFSLALPRFARAPANPPTSFPVLFPSRGGRAGKKMATGTFTKTLKTLIKMHRTVLKSSKLAHTMLLVHRRILSYWLLGSQGIVVKCTSRAIFFSYGGFSAILPLCGAFHAG